MTRSTRLPFDEFRDRLAGMFVIPHVVGEGPPVSTDDAMRHVQQRNAHGAIDPVEGIVYRVERKGSVDFLAKFVRPEKQDGSYLREVSGRPNVWNWKLWEPKE